MIVRYLRKNIHWISFSSTEGSASIEKLPVVLFDPVKAHSASPREAAFQEAYGTKLTFWEYLEELVEQPNGTMGPRPELDVWINAMIASGQIEAGASYVGVSVSMTSGSVPLPENVAQIIRGMLWDLAPLSM